MSLNCGSLFRKVAEVTDQETGEVKKREYYEGLLQLVEFPHLSGRVSIVPRHKPNDRSPGWTVKLNRSGQWFEIGSAFDAELKAGGTWLNIYLLSPGMRERVNVKAWPNPDDPDHTDDEPAFRVAFDVKRGGAMLSPVAPATNGAGAAVPFDN